MSESIPIQFGKRRIDQFTYLIITGIFVLIFAAFMSYIAKGLFGVGEAYYEEYKIFYQICGAALGFIVSQAYIRLHTKSFKRGGSQ